MSLNSLPQEIWDNILSYFEEEEKFVFSFTNIFFNSIIGSIHRIGVARFLVTRKKRSQLEWLINNKILELDVSISDRIEAYDDISLYKFM